MFTIRIHTAKGQVNSYSGGHEKCMAIAHTIEAFPSDVILLEIVDKEGNTVYKCRFFYVTAPSISFHH